MDTFNLLLCLSLLSFYLINFLVAPNNYVWLCIHTVALVKYLVLWHWHLIFCVITCTSSLGMIHIRRLFWHEYQPIFTSSQKWIVFWQLRVRYHNRCLGHLIWILTNRKLEENTIKLGWCNFQGLYRLSYQNNLLVG